MATALAPSRPTKKMSTTANTDSISISRTIGTASSTTARPMGASVKSWCEPRTASLRVDQTDGSARSATAVTVGVSWPRGGPVSTGREGSLDHSDHEPA